MIGKVGAVVGSADQVRVSLSTRVLPLEAGEWLRKRGKKLLVRDLRDR